MKKLIYLLTISFFISSISMACNGADADEFYSPKELADIEIEYLTGGKIAEKLAQEEENARKYREEQALLMEQIICQMQQPQRDDSTSQEEEQTDLKSVASNN